MGEWLKKKLIGLGVGIVGLAAWLGYHSFIDDQKPVKELDKIPQTVFAGGGGNLTLSVSMNEPGYLSASFSRHDGEEEKTIHAYEELKGGDHFFKVDLPADLSYGYFELEIHDAKVGSQLAWDVQFEGRTVLNEEEELRQPLKSNEAFALIMEFSDLDELRRYGQGGSEDEEGDAGGDD